VKHSVSLTLTANNEREWQSVFNLLSTVMLDNGDRFNATLTSFETESPAGPTRFDENTMRTVFETLHKHDLSEDQATDIINHLQNAGILFRESQ
jgi:homoserine acetyltransferase